MSIKSELNKTASLLQGVKKAIIGRGGNLTLNSGFKDLPEAIWNIPSNDSLSYLDVSEIAYMQTVPSDVENSALISQVGGMTYKSNNLANINVLTLNRVIAENDTITVKASASSAGASSGRTLKKLCPSLKVGDTCILTAKTTGTYNIIYLSGANISWQFGKTNTITQEMLDSQVVFYASGVDTSAVISEFMIANGTKALPYEPYFEGLRDAKVISIESRDANSLEPIDTFEIPEAVQSLEGWGLGINAEYNNHLEWRNGRIIYVQQADKVVLDGVNRRCGYIGKSNAGNYFGQFNLPKTSISGTNLISSNFDKTVSNGAIGHIRISNNKILIYNYDQTITTESAWNEWLQSNPIEVVYPLAEPIETDITHLFTDTSQFLKVEGGGSIVFNNEHKLAVPSKIKYVVKVGI